MKQIKRTLPRKKLRFEVHLADHCNLNCKGCDHFSPIAPKHFISTDDFEMDFAHLGKLSKQGHFIDEIQLLGGEPLLHPQIEELITIVRKFLTRSKINIITNGLLLLKMPSSFWECCRKNNIKILITNYPVKLNHIEIKRQAQKFKVKLAYMSEGILRNLYKWNFDVSGSQCITDSFRHCFKANLCAHLSYGKMYACPTIPCIKILNEHFGQDFKIEDGDYIDIYKASSIHDILNFLCRPAPFCRYCRTNDIPETFEWAVSKKELKEWL